jgi:hypothetical protein
VLHEGPLAFAAAESRPLRARFLAECGWGDEAAIRSDLERRDRALADAPHLVLWFEHDLYDQLQLLQALSQTQDSQQVELVQADDFLGHLDVDALERLWQTRRVVDRATLAVALEAWRAVCAGEPAAILARDTTSLPYLEPALRRLL